LSNQVKPHGLICYFCGNPADGADDHVPPEVLFRGMNGRSYKSPQIITVPSCHKHNDGASNDDEVLAWVMSDAGGVGSNAAIDVFQALHVHVSDRIYNDRSFADERLKRIGVRVLRDPTDYDENGAPKRIVYDAESLRRSEHALRERWMILERNFQKIAAGLFFYATKGNHLGVAAVDSLEVVVPSFKQFGETITYGEFEIDEATFFSRRPPWREIASGSPDVFRCTIAHSSSSKRFEMKLVFYSSIEVWIKTPAQR
jgi:hypothetical protein